MSILCMFTDPSINDLDQLREQPVSASTSSDDQWTNYMIGAIAVILLAVLILALAVRRCRSRLKAMPKPPTEQAETPAFSNAMYGVIGNFARQASHEDGPNPASPDYTTEKINPVFDEHAYGAVGGYSPQLDHKIIIPPTPDGSPSLTKKSFTSGRASPVSGKGICSDSPSLPHHTLSNETFSMPGALPTQNLQSHPSYLDSQFILHPPPYTAEPEGASSTPIHPATNRHRFPSDKQELLYESEDFGTLRGAPTPVLSTIQIVGPHQNHPPITEDEESLYCSLDDLDTMSVFI